MDKRTLIITLSVVLAVGICFGAEEFDFTRAIYNSLNYSEDVSFGLNTEYTRNNWFRMGPEQAIERLKSNSLRAAENNMTHIAGLYYLQAKPDFEYARAINENGHEEENTPSPVDRTYWLRVIHEPALKVANLSLHYSISALVFDFELYYASKHDTGEDHKWRRSFYTYDTAALRDFANYTGIEIPEMEADERHDWLTSKGLIQDYMSWQEEVVWEMARETEKAVHSINPNLSLGVLGFNDFWLDWSTLEGFFNGVTVTLWTEKTYGGYEEKTVEYLRNQSRVHGLDCQVLPGLWCQAMKPWVLIEDMERVTRHNGAFWIYRQNKEQAYKLAEEEEYGKAFRLFNRYVLMDQSQAEPLPSFYLHPGIVALPYMGSNGVSVLMKPKIQLDPNDEVYLITGAQELEYVGMNLSVRKISSRRIAAVDLPCFMYGFEERDLLATEAWSLILELRSLLESYGDLGLLVMEDLETKLSNALLDFEAGRYSEVKATLDPLSESGYSQVFKSIYPSVLEALESPRESDIPLGSIREILNAEKLYGSGRTAEGNTYLVRGLRSWSLAVSEFPPGLSVSLLVLFVLVTGSGPYHFCCQDGGY